MVDQIRTVIEQLDRFTAMLITRLTLSITSELVIATPVDTGWARANWIPQIGAPLDSPVGQRDASGVSSAGARQSIGLASILTYTLNSGPIFISNNVPYITDLNEGTSRQAPAGFVQDSIRAGILRTS